MFEERIDETLFTPARARDPNEQKTGFLDLAIAARDGSYYIDNVNGREEAWSEAFRRRSKAIKDATGQDIGDDPSEMKALSWPALWSGLSTAGAGVREVRRQALQQRLRDLADQYPQFRDLIRPDVTFDQEAEQIAREHERRLADVTDRYGGTLPAFAPQLAGGFYGSFNDPVNVGTLAVGPAGRVGRGASQVLWMGVKQGAANAGVEALSQPMVQAWRAQAGLDYGLDQAALNVGTAGAFGFGLDAGVRGAFRGGRRAVTGKWTPELDPAAPPAGPSSGPAALPEPPRPRPADPEVALDAAARELPGNALARKAADGDLDAMWRVAKALGIDGEPEIRGAKAAAEIDAEFTARMKEAGAEDWRGQERLLRALQAAEEPDGLLPLVHDEPPAPKRAPDAPEPTGDALALALAERAEPGVLSGRIGAAADQARALARLSEDAFADVASGRARGELAVLVGEHVADPTRHAPLLAELVDLDPPTIEAARSFLALRLAEPAARAEPRVVAQEIAERHGEVVSATAERMAEGMAPEQAVALRGVLEDAAGRPGPVADAARMLEAGASRKQAAEALAKRLERIGSEAPEAAPQPRGIDEPGGTDAAAQTAELERLLKGELDDAKAVRDGKPTRDDETMLAIRAFHGSPHDFDRFDSGRIGTGEGAQAFGHGLYFAENQKVAHEYHVNLGTSEPTFDGKLFDDGDPRHLAARWIDSGIPKADAVERARSSEQFYRDGGNGERADFYGAVAKALESGDMAAVSKTVRGGVYEVSLDVEPHQLLDLEKSIAQQPEVRAALRRLKLSDAAIEDLGGDVKMLADMPRGRDLYDTLASLSGIGSVDKASQVLRDAGIVGIRYLDAGSRGAPDGTRNIVIFPGEEHRIKIVAKNGQPVSEAERAQVLLAMRRGDPAAASTRAPTDAALLRAEHGLAPAAEARSAELRREVERVIARIAPPEVRAEIEDRLHFRGREVDGWFDPHERLIHVALSAADPVRVATEEAGHALKAAGLLTDQEYGLLWAHAQRHDLRKQYNIDEQYKPIYGARWKAEPDRLEAALREETIMKMIAAHASGERFGGMVDRILETVAKVLGAIRDALGVKGFRTVHDVFRAIESGEVAGRGASVEPMRAAELAPMMAEVDRGGEVKGVAEACRG